MSNKYQRCLRVFLAFSALFFLGQTIQAQTSPANAEEYTGNIISFNGPEPEPLFSRFALTVKLQPNKPAVF